MSQNTLIELKSLSKRYGYGDAESYALQDLDLTIQRGEFIMIMGPSGCGKTTLLNILGLLDRASSGDYYLNGESVARISASRQAKLRAQKIGFIFQNFNLIGNLPAIENVALPLVYAGYSKTARLKTASSLLERFDLQKREYYLPYQLSGGQQQHVAIARALVANPEIILADEPTGNLDSHASKNVMDLLKAIHEEGNTIIMVTHNPALISYATRVIHLLDGHIATDTKTVADWDLPQPVAVKIKHHAAPLKPLVTNTDVDAEPPVLSPDPPETVETPQPIEPAEPLASPLEPTEPLVEPPAIPRPSYVNFAIPEAEQPAAEPETEQTKPEPKRPKRPKRRKK